MCLFDRVASNALLNPQNMFKVNLWAEIKYWKEYERHPVLK